MLVREWQAAHYAPDVLALILQFLASTAGIALLLAIIRGLFALFLDRGPRRRIVAIKAAHETADLLQGDDAVLVRSLRDRELAALSRAVERTTAWRTRWSRVISWFRDNPRKAIGIGLGAVTVALGSALAASFLTNPDALSQNPIDTPLQTALVALASTAAVGTVSVLRTVFERRSTESLTLDLRSAEANLILARLLVELREKENDAPEDDAGA